MAKNGVQPGEMKDRIEILALEKDQVTGEWSWEADCTAWVKAEAQTTKAIFSNYGVGKDKIEFLARWAPVSRHDAIRWKGQHCFILDIQPLNKLYQRIICAGVEVSQCRGEGEPGFPGILVDKYLRRESDQRLHSEDKLTFVLVTPKEIVLSPNSIVTIGGTEYVVMAEHLLDEWQNEYEVMRMRDL